MGCCFSRCRKSDNNQTGEPSERTHLLTDPVGDVSALHCDNSDDLLTQYPNSLPKKADEQSALSKILQEAATNVIDVAALGAHNMEQHEYMERMNKYHAKINIVAGGSWQNPIKHQCLLVDIPTPEKILAADPININDFIMIKKASHDAKTALEDVKVDHREDLVVPFRIPC